MSSKPTAPISPLLRQEAETKIDQLVPILVNPQPGENLLHELLHELRVHQVELEIQNEALRQSQIELEASRDRYVDFYDFAPAGFLSLDHEAKINEINLTGAAMLGLERSKLTHRRFVNYIVAADLYLWQLHLQSVLNSDNKQSCELKLRRGDGSDFYVQLDSIKTGDAADSNEIEKSSPPSLNKNSKKLAVRIVITDISERKQREAIRHKTNDKPGECCISPCIC